MTCCSKEQMMIILPSQAFPADGYGVLLDIPGMISEN